MIAGFAQARERTGGLFGGGTCRLVDLAIGKSGAIERGGDGILERFASGRGRRCRNLPCPDGGVDELAGLFEFLFDAADGERERFGTRGGFAGKPVEIHELGCQRLAGSAHAIQTGFERIIGASDFLASLTGRADHLLGLTRDRFAHLVDLGSQVPGKAFKRGALGGETLGEIAGIVSAGIGNRFQSHALVANLT